MINPQVSIIMATYNRSFYIMETLKSIQNQTFQDWECLIIDDGGNDNTFDVIELMINADKRFQFSIRPDSYKKGLPGCRNYGLDEAKGDFIIFFDDDDIVHPMNLELCVKELKASNYLFCRYIRTVFTGDFNYNFNFNKEYDFFTIGINDVDALLKHELPFNSCAIMWKKECFTLNRFVEELMYAEEWELYSRILSQNISGISINKILFYGRKHPESNTGEFYNNNPIRRKSNVDAILLVLQNLKEKKLLTYSIIHYFVIMSTQFKEFNLFTRIIVLLELSYFSSIKWRIIYYSLYVKMPLYRLKKKFKNEYNKLIQF